VSIRVLIELASLALRKLGIISFSDALIVAATLEVRSAGK
jgi:hypothetical protein